MKNPQVTPKLALEGSPDYVGISCFVNDLPTVRAFADEIKKESPLTTILVGGNGVLSEAEPLSNHPSIDFVVRGEGAYAVEDMINGVPDVRGVVFQDGKLIHNNQVRMNLDDAGLPLRTEEMMQGRKRKDLVNPAPSVQKYATTYTTAGCNNHCSFCQTQKMFPGGIRFRSPEIVLEEVIECQEKCGTNYMLLMDPVALGGRAGFQSGHAQKCADLLHGTGMKFYGLTRLDMPTESWDTLARAGVRKVGVGIESLVKWGIKDGNPEMKIQKINDYAREAIERGILCRGLFMVGYEGQTPEDITKEIEGIKQLENVTDIRIGWYTPFEKTQEEIEEMYYRGEVYSADISKRDTTFPVFKIKGVPDSTDAQKLKADMYKAFYGCGSADRTAKRIIGIDPTLRQSYEEFNTEILEPMGCKINL